MSFLKFKLWLTCFRILILIHWRVIIMRKLKQKYLREMIKNNPFFYEIKIYLIRIFIDINSYLMEQGKASLLSHEQNTDDNTIPVSLADNRFDGLGKVHLWAYGVGHFVNDLVAACWFNYLFYFLRKVVQTDAAAGALLVGQIADGLATPAVGVLSDKFNSKIGQRKPWYIGGLVLVILGFIPLFSGFKNEDSLGSEYAFYTIFAGLFNIGWASLQISHMSLVPALTCSRKRRDKLNNLRNLFTFISNFTVLGIGLIVFSIMHDRLLEYKIVTYLSVGIGFVFTIFFIWKINEPQLTKICTQKQQKLKILIAQQKSMDQQLIRNLSQISTGEDNQKNQVASATKARQSKLDWFKMPKFYLFGVCYMGVRLYTNLFGTLLPFYLTDVLQMGGNDTEGISFNIALVPMLAYASSVVMSTQLNKFYQNFGRKKALFVGTAICIICLVVMAFIKASNYWIIYILAFFIGASQSLVLSTGINLISDVVGAKAKTGAFVFGIYSLMDKFSSGIAIFLIGNSESYSKQSSELTVDDISFIRLTMVLIPGIACLLSSLIVLSYPIEQYGKEGKISEGLLQQKSELQQQLVA